MQIFVRSGDWFFPPGLSWLGVVWAVFGVVASAYVVHKSRRPGPRFLDRLFLFKTLFSVVAVAIPIIGEAPCFFPSFNL